jgi:hypothetical protein
LSSHVFEKEVVSGIFGDEQRLINSYKEITALLGASQLVPFSQYY